MTVPGGDALEIQSEKPLSPQTLGQPEAMKREDTSTTCKQIPTSISTQIVPGTHQLIRAVIILPMELMKYLTLVLIYLFCFFSLVFF